jgi:hypothetical protein
MGGLGGLDASTMPSNPAMAGRHRFVPMHIHGEILRRLLWRADWPTSGARPRWRGQSPFWGFSRDPHRSPSCAYDRAYLKGLYHGPAAVTAATRMNEIVTKATHKDAP